MVASHFSSVHLAICLLPSLTLEIETVLGKAPGDLLAAKSDGPSQRPLTSLWNVTLLTPAPLHVHFLKPFSLHSLWLSSYFPGFFRQLVLCLLPRETIPRIPLSTLLLLFAVQYHILL